MATNLFLGIIIFIICHELPYFELCVALRAILSKLLVLVFNWEWFDLSGTERDVFVQLIDSPRFKPSKIFDSRALSLILILIYLSLILDAMLIPMIITFQFQLFLLVFLMAIVLGRVVLIPHCLGLLFVLIHGRLLIGRLLLIICQTVIIRWRPLKAL